MGNAISSDLQSRLIALSSLVNEDAKSSQNKSSEVEKLGNIILKKINAEISSLPTGARIFLEKIALSIIDKNWSGIPDPIAIEFDFKKFKEIAETLSLASVSAMVDLFELFRVLIDYKAQQALSLSKIGIMDSELSIAASTKQFEAQALANEKELVAGVLSGAAQVAQGAAQAGSSARSLVKNAKLAVDTKQNMADSLKTAKFGKKLKDAKIERTELINEKKSIEQRIEVGKKNGTLTADEISTLEAKKVEFNKKISLKDANIRMQSKTFGELEADNKAMEFKNQQKADSLRYWDQIRKGVIDGVKGVADMGVSGARFMASGDKLQADQLESAKNIFERSSNAMNEASRSQIEALKRLFQTFSDSLQTNHASLTKQFT